MTKKDYKLIAKTLYECGLDAWSEGHNQHEFIVYRLATILAADNGKFNKEKFLEAAFHGKGIER